MTALSNVEAKKRFEFLEAVSGTMDAHLRYFKQVSHMAEIFSPCDVFISNMLILDLSCV